MRDRLGKLFLLNHQELILANLVTAALVLRFDDVARDRIHELLLQTMAGALIDLPKRNPLSWRDGRVERNGAGNQGQLEEALPMRTRRHLVTPTASRTETHSVPDTAADVFEAAVTLEDETVRQRLAV